MREVQEAFSPHAWGWTFAVERRKIKREVFPTRVGVDRRSLRHCVCTIRFPHTRGGGPMMPVGEETALPFSPHAWGWTATSSRCVRKRLVFPTRVGVDQCTEAQQRLNGRFPHTRGGGPPDIAAQYEQMAFSPHAWGWTDMLDGFPASADVFPTRVGVDQLQSLIDWLGVCFPHTRGGGPLPRFPCSCTFAFSPHAWGWTGGFLSLLKHL